MGDYSPRASKIRDDETEHHRVSFGRLAGPESGHGRFQNSDGTPHLAELIRAAQRVFFFLGSRLGRAPRSPLRISLCTIEMSITPFR